MPTNSVTIVNNTGREIRHVYFSPTNEENWGSDQLNNFVIAAGGTREVNSSCSAGDIKVIAENQDGCFFYQVVSCGSNVSWTIASDASADCGN